MLDGLLHPHSSIPYVQNERRVKREKPARCNKSDVYYQTSISTCFEHHYAHHQENKTVYYCIRCSALVVLVVVGCGCVELGRELCALCEGYFSTPDDGHNDAQNMLR